MKKISFAGEELEVSDADYHDLYNKALAAGPIAKIRRVIDDLVVGSGYADTFRNCLIATSQADASYIVELPLPHSNTHWTLTAFRIVEGLIEKFPSSYPVHGKRYGLTNPENSIGVRVYVQ